MRCSVLSRPIGVQVLSPYSPYRSSVQEQTLVPPAGVQVLSPNSPAGVPKLSESGRVSYLVLSLGTVKKEMPLRSSNLYPIVAIHGRRNQQTRRQARASRDAVPRPHASPLGRSISVIAKRFDGQRFSIFLFCMLHKYNTSTDII